MSHPHSTARDVVGFTDTSDREPSLAKGQARYGSPDWQELSEFIAHAAKQWAGAKRRSDQAADFTRDVVKKAKGAIINAREREREATDLAQDALARLRESEATVAYLLARLEDKEHLAEVAQAWSRTDHAP